MASLVEELVTVLEEEEKIYQTLISYGEKKTDILIRADVPELEKLTCLEQLASDDLVTHSNQPVSYTHLDVYKRQVVSMWKQDIDRMLFCIWKGILQTVF